MTINFERLTVWTTDPLRLIHIEFHVNPDSENAPTSHVLTLSVDDAEKALRSLSLVADEIQRLRSLER